MKKFKMLSAAVLTATALMVGVPAGVGAQDSVDYSIFELAESEILKEGSRGENVKIMQRGLNEAMGAELMEDGIFGPNTKRALLAFQESNNNLANDGLYGPNTHRELSKEVNSFGFSESLLQIGSRGNSVKILQEGLNDMSYNLDVDGIYGPKTEAAVLKFQERFPELVNDGIFGPNTKSVMDKVLND